MRGNSGFFGFKEEREKEVVKGGDGCWSCHACDQINKGEEMSGHNLELGRGLRKEIMG